MIFKFAVSANKRTVNIQYAYDFSVMTFNFLFPRSNVTRTVFLFADGITASDCKPGFVITQFPSPSVPDITRFHRYNSLCNPPTRLSAHDITILHLISSSTPIVLTKT